MTGALSLTNGAGDDLVGTDSASLSSLSVTGTSTFANGEGASTIKWDPLVLNLGAIAITNGNGFNMVTIGNSIFGSSDALGVSITSGSGGSHTTLRGTYVGAVNVTNADGNDELGFDSLSVTGNVTIKNGAGGSKTDFKSEFGVTGAFSLTNGAGDDLVGTDSANWFSFNVTGALTIANGNGAADVRLSPSNINASDTVLVGGNLSLTNGIGNTSWKLEARTSTTVTGSTTITCGEGSDSLDLGAAAAQSNDSYQGMTVNFGGGSSTVNFSGKETLNGNLSLSAGPGVHTVKVLQTLATKNATLNLQGVGTDTGNVAVTVNVFQNWNVTGNLSVTTNHGNDNIGIDAPLVVTGTTTISTGTGDDVVRFDNVGVALTGNVSITTGAGKDLVRFANGGTVTGNLTVNTGTQNDQVVINKETFQGTVSLTLGGGADVVAIQQFNDTTKSRFEKAVTINSDAGDDVVKIGLANDANDFAEFLGTLTINGGAGLDIVRFKNVALGGTRSNTFAFAPVIATFELQE